MAKPTKRSIEIYTFKEGTHWIAAWRRFDLVAQGDTERKTISNGRIAKGWE